MVDRLHRSFAYRSLLTDTLPYEVPVIFSNDRFHANLSAPPTGGVEAVLARLLERKSNYTVPYNYSIAKDPKRRTTLSIVHPLTQRAMAEFYELHGGGMLSHCARGRFSLRKPVSLASPFAKEIVDDDERAKSGIPQLLADAGEADMAHMSSYFAYGKYNLLGKFIASREYIRLETRYALMRQVDVSKCFYNIYTHSVTWAVKSKPYAKEQKDTYSFEAAFDKLMQRCNYNETNGIVVGPEFSRIFAEIILQDIDECVEADLRGGGLRAGLEYDIRRYVDDYFLFSGDPVTLDRVESCLRQDFLTSGVVREAFDKMVSAPKMTYFTYITLAFCMRKAVGEFQSGLDAIHGKARQRVLAPGVDILRDAEEYLLAVDYLASPEVSSGDKQSFYQALFGQNNTVSYSTLSELGENLGFADWTGVTVEHQLRRKELRPVYAWG